MARVAYEPAEDVQRDVRLIVEKLGLSYIDLSRVVCIRSRGSRSIAVARIHGLPRIWQVALGVKPAYVIEVISENYDALSRGEKLRVLIHELLHIPKTFSGGLRPHGSIVNSEEVEKLYRRLRGDVEHAENCEIRRGGGKRGRQGSRRWRGSGNTH